MELARDPRPGAFLGAPEAHVQTRADAMPVGFAPRLQALPRRLAVEVDRHSVVPYATRYATIVGNGVERARTICPGYRGKRRTLWNSADLSFRPPKAGVAGSIPAGRANRSSESSSLLVLEVRNLYVTAEGFRRTVDLNERKQQFSISLVRAVAAVCGLAYSIPGTDDDSVDATLARRGGGGTLRSPKLDLQLKCSGGLKPSAQHVTFVLPIKNYDELRPTDIMVPRILVVASVPADLDGWLTCSEDQFLLRNCAYWMSIRGFPDSANEASVTLHLPRAQIFDPAGVNSIFQRLSTNGLP